MPSITFHGAAGTVTGSRHLIEYGGKRILIDCGLFQGPRDIRDRNWVPFPVEPQSIDAVILTHAHNDHIGYLPRLVKMGFSGPVYCTTGTAGLCRISLPDGGRLQQEEAAYRNRHAATRHNPALPLYTESEAYQALKHLQPRHYYQYQELPGKATFRFIPAGHILGAAFVELYFENGERILMSGDLGRQNQPIIRDPSPVDFAEYLVIESTYGDRLHPGGDPKADLERIFTRAAREGRVVIVPSFAIGRTQERLYYLHLLADEGKMPRIPIYVDSPMANRTTLLYIDSEEDHDLEMRIDLREGHSPLQDEFIHLVRDQATSKQLNEKSGPFVVIAGSGMCTGGRVQHHLLARLDKPSTTVLFTGYQAEGTPGRAIKDGAERIRLLGREVEIRANIESLDMLSAHCDYQGMLDWLGNFKTPPKKTFIVHGEPEASLALKRHIAETYGWDCIIPAQGDKFKLA